MPIYEYVCKSCQKSFEKLVKSMSGEEKVKCPECGSSKTAKALSVFAVGGEPAGKSSSLPMGGCGRCSADGTCPMGN